MQTNMVTEMTKAQTVAKLNSLIQAEVAIDAQYANHKISYTAWQTEKRKITTEFDTVRNQFLGR